MKILPILPALLLILGGVGIAAHLTRAQSAPTSRRTTKVAPQPESSREGAESETSARGGMFVPTESGEPQVFPLKHTDVQAKISGNVSRVEVTQTFENPFEDPLEAIYVFPLPDEAAVDDMEIRIGDRVIKGDIKRREEAQEIYEQAVREGRTAGLLEQERANIFTQSLANIKPGEQIDVTIRYSDSLQFEGGDYEFVFPMVVGPRFIPGQPVNPQGDTTQVPDASRITPPVLKPGTRSGHDISVAVEIEAGVPISKVRSPSHKIQVQTEGDTTQVTLASEDTIPNKDLILRYQVAGPQTRTAILTQTDERGGHFAIYLIPALDYRQEEIVPKDVVFLMDTSGSQRGEPLDKSKELMRQFIKALNPDDTFTIIDFANTATRLSRVPLNNTQLSRSMALDYINGLQANGGTQLMNGIDAVMKFPPAKEGRLRSVVLLTDGYIGNEAQVLADVQDRLKSGNRLYSFGVGSSVNRFLLDRLAEVGRGTVQVVRQDEPTDTAVAKFTQQINNPVLTDIQVSWEGEGEAPEVYPLAAPDLFTNQPLVLFGRKADGRNGRLKITSKAPGGRTYETSLAINFDQVADQGNTAIAQLWGRARIKDLMNQMFGGETVSGVEAVTNTALTYRLLSQYTAFVAVSEEVRVDPDGTRRTVEVPVELPEGVDYGGIFGPADGAPVGAAPPPAPVFGANRTPNASAGSRNGPGRKSVPRPQASPVPTVGSQILSSDLAIDEEIATEAEPKPASKLKVVKIEGLDPAPEADLTQRLERLVLKPDLSGELKFEMRASQGRITLVALDDQASTLEDKATIDAIRQLLRSWQPPTSVQGTIRITLQVDS